jgi:hypothetical protein
VTRYESIVRTLVEPLVTNKEALMIRETQNDDGKSVTVNVFAAKNDIAVLIGRKGTIATALRETLSIAGKQDNVHVFLKLEGLGEEKTEDEE